MTGFNLDSIQKTSGSLREAIGITAHWLSHYFGCILSFLSDFTPSPAFLTDVAAFEGIILAIAIPLSLEIVSRVSERYQSEVISKRFIREWPIKLLPILLILNILMAVALKFFMPNNPTTPVWKLLAWITFAGFLIIASIFFIFIAKLKRYMTDPEFVLDNLFNEAEKALKK